MGTYIYIKKDSIKRAGIGMESNEVTREYPCCCGEVDSGYCDNCNSSSEKITEVEVQVSGLNIIMEEFSDTVMHVANAWGSSRIPLLEFIGKHSFVEGEDWYEA